jgi:hypothetical protein
MAKKNKKKTSSKNATRKVGSAGSDNFLAEAKEEMIALEAIFDKEFEVHKDVCGFNLVIFPHPGDAESNFVSVKLVVRWAISAASQTCLHPWTSQA